MQAHKHFMLRVDWLRDVRDTDYDGRIANMVRGLVGARHGAAGRQTRPRICRPTRGSSRAAGRTRRRDAKRDLVEGRRRA